MSGSRASTSSAAATKPCWSRPRERGATRQAILDAAHRLAELHGEAALTLSSVAGEAGIARATIYGYFAGKSELLSQLNGGAASVPEPLREAEPVAAHKEDVPAPIPSEPDDSTDYGEMMRRQAEQLDKLAKRIIVPKATKEGTDGAISRLDARLRVVEQSLADLEGRRSCEAKELTDRIDAAIEALQQSQQRLENSDNRQQQALAELRLEVHNLKSRVDIGPEAAASAAEHAEPAASQAVDFQPWTHSPTAEPAEPNQVSAENRQPDYLSSARRAAIDAAAVTTEENAGASRLQFRWRWLFGAAIAAGAGAGIIFNLPSDVAVQPPAVSRFVAHDKAQLPSRQAENPGLTSRARAGNTEAQLILGLKLLNGTGAAMNIEKAAGWLERAAESGQPVAQETIGVLYQTGTGVAADMPKAIHWYEAAAHSGNVRAMTNLAKAYAGGWSAGTDYAKAARWFERAAGFGDVDAQFDLAILCERGEGVPRNLTEAYKWYSIAAKQGDGDAMARAATVRVRLLPAYLREASAAAEGFKPSLANRAANDIPALAAAK